MLPIDQLSSEENFSEETLLHIFKQHLNQIPNKVLYRFFANGEEENDSRTCIELYKRSEIIASNILEHVNPGDRVLLLYPSGLDFVDAFLGCLMAGVIAVPAFPPQGKRRIGRLEKIVSDCKASMILTTDTVYTKNLKWFSNDVFADVKWLQTDQLTDVLDKSFPKVTSATVAFLQYTSGSTGDPKGVIVDHANIIDNSEIFKSCFRTTPDSVGVSWLPIYHDMGLIGNIIQSLYVGFELVILPPTAFIQKPIRWLKLISKYKGTVSCAPNFAYDVCTNQIKDEDLVGLDLSSWRVAINGSEPIRPDTMNKFADRFESYGFNRTTLFPGYGMAETTLVISGCRFNDEPTVLHLNKNELHEGTIQPYSTIQKDSEEIRLIGNGPVHERLKAKIVNPNTKRVCENDEVGEVWISGASVAKGYWNKQELSKEIFDAYTVNTDGVKNKKDGPYLRTGDMGFLYDDEIYISGRLKEMMIFNGVNHFPQDIERSVQKSHSDLQNNAGVAGTLVVDGIDKLIIVQEVKRTSMRSYDFEEIVKNICETVLAEHELSVHTIVLLSPGRVSKTSSGKIQRLATKSAYANQTLEGILNTWIQGDSLTKKTKITKDPEPIKKSILNDELTNWLKDTISQELSIEKSRINTRTSFAELGMTSFQGVRLSGLLSDYVKEEVSPTLIYSYPNIADLVMYLTGEEEHISSSQVDNIDDLQKNEPIAVISMAAKFPGARNIEEFWENLKSGKDAVTEIPKERWDIDEYYKTDVDGYSMNTRWGGFIDEVDVFDASFFGISPREAKLMDPQQRVLLELSNELIERAGYASSDLKGTKTGVYIGVEQVDYSAYLQNNKADLYSGTGAALSIISNRLSYYYDFRGPSMSIDTACSASLTSIHTAVKDIRNGECTMAIAGGVSLILSPHITVALSQANMMSKDGKCKTFDDSANGYVRSEGCGLVLLKPLPKAIEDGDKIECVIRGSAINQDGRSNGLTAPNGLAQQEVIKSALKSANLAAKEIDYVEAHGTGTALGDPIEISALDTIYGENRNQKNPLIVGSVKSNIGHLEAAAGVAGLIKTIYCLKHSQIPKQLHYNIPNTHINWEKFNVRIPARELGWDKKENATRKAGISSFGFGGTNVHVIIEEGPVLEENQDKNSLSRSLELIALSGKNEKALQAQVDNLIKHINVNSKLSLDSLSYSLSLTRNHYSHRYGVVCNNVSSLLEQLNNFDLETKKVSTQESLKTAFLYTGQGSQYINMGKSLYANEHVFRENLDKCATILDSYLDVNLLTVLFTDKHESLLDQTNYTQPALFSIGFALSKLWESWGVKPDVVMGHSIGELTAACIAGVFSLEDGLKLVASRGRLMQSVSEKGGMVSVQCNEKNALELLEKYKGKITIAATNSPNQTVLSGAIKSIEDLCQLLSSKNIKHKQLQVSHAFHSPLMDSILKTFKEVASSITYHPAQCDIISNVSGIKGNIEVTNPDYWVEHISAPVSFLKGMQTLETMNINTYLEVGPHPVLIAQGGQCVSDSTKAVWLGSIRKGKNDIEILLESLIEWYMQGGDVDWKSFYRGREAKKIELPTYAFQRQRYWIETEANSSNKKQVNNINNSVQAQVTTPIMNNSRNQSKFTFDEIYNHLAKLVSSSLQMNIEELSPKSPLLNLGADSLVLMEITKKIEKEYKVAIPIRRLFEDITDLGSIVDYILSNIEDIPEPSVNSINTNHVDQVNNVVKVNEAIGTTKKAGDATLNLILNQFSEQNKILSDYLNTNGATQNQTQIGNNNLAPDQEETNTVTIASQKPKEKKEGALTGNLSDTSFFFQKLPENQEKQLSELIEKFTSQTKKSKAYTAKFRKVLADFFMTRNFKMATKEMEYLIVCDKASGSRFTDIDGNSYIDITMGYGSCIFGHQPDFIVNAIQEQLFKGITVGPMAKLSGEVAALISELTGMERVAFANTGTEAVSFVMRLARAATGKKKIVIFSGSYHGHIETVLGMQGDSGTEPMVPGVTNNMVKDLIVLRYTDDDILDQIRSHADDLAGIMVEPVRSRFPDFQPVELLKQLKELTLELDIPLIFDEMITGFRIMPGGAQEYFGIKADIATYGKIAGGGMPLGVVAGSRRYIDIVDGGDWSYGDDSYPKVPKTLVAGTFTRHPLTMAASKAILTRIKEIGKEEYLALNQKTDDLMKRLNTYFKQEALPIEVVNFGSLFRFKFKENFDLLLFHLIQKGIYAWAPNNLYITFAHTDDDINEIYKAICESVYTVYKLSDCKSSLIPSESVVASKVTESKSTLAQQQLFLLDQIDTKRSLAYILSLGISMKGDLDLSVLKKALNQVFKSHDILCSTFSEDGKKVIYDSSITMHLEETNISMLDEESKENAFKELIEKDSKTPFSLTNGCLVRANLIKFSENQHKLLLSAHHIIVDGWSFSLFVQELIKNYDAISHGKYSFGDRKIQFPDYITWIDKQRESDEWRGHEYYFIEKFKEKSFRVSLPFGNQISDQIDMTNGSAILSIPRAEVQELKQWSGSQGLTLFMTFLSVYKLLLFKLCTQKEIVVGIPVGGRFMPDIDNAIGYFSHIMPLISEYDSNQSISDYLKDLKRNLFTAYDHQEFPYSDLIALFQEEKSITENQLINVTFNFDVAVGSAEMGGLQLELEENKPLYNHFDLQFNAFEHSGELVVRLDYRKSIISDAIGKELLDCFKHLLSQITTLPNTLLSEIEVIPEYQKEKLLKTFNNTAVVYPEDKSLVNLFENQVSKTPNAIAVVYSDQQLTYKELDEKANQLANLIISKGIHSSSRVGVLSNRGFDMIIGILGVLKSACTYVPLDPTLPSNRLGHIVEDSGLTHVIYTDEELVSKLPITECMFVDIQESHAYDKSGFDTIREFDSNAYVMYTSGTTGMPKGILISDENVIALINDPSIAIDSSDKVLQWSNYAFDGSTYEIFGSLLSGASLYMIDSATASDALAISNVINENQLSIVFITTALFNSLADCDTSRLSSVRMLLFGGEKVSVQPTHKILSVLDSGKLIHVYGPTETTVYATFYPIHDLSVDADTVPIGKPLSNTSLYVLDNNNELLPAGAVGELCIAGAGLARGYLNQEELTKEKFISNPFDTDPESRLYKTGDLVRWLPSGDIEFVGRKDSQVKIRGYRIELGEIENTLSSISELESNCVLVKEDSSQNKRLVGYVVFNGNFDKEAVQTHLHSKLPDYMVPQLWVSLDAMPLTSNGKIDRKKLPDPDMSLLSTQEYVAPRNEVEEKLVVIWQELLGLERIGVYDNFFELGGHSLLATRLVSLIRRDLEIEVPIRAVFINTSISALELYLSTESQNVVLPAIVSSDHQGRIPLSFSQERLWFLDQLQGSVEYHMSGGLRLKGSLDVSILERALKLLVDRHEILRTVLCSEEGIGYQEVISSDAWELSTVSVLSDQKVEDLIPSFSEAPFDLSGDYMFRSCLYNLGSDDHLLVIVFHHIASDGWSIPIFIKEFIAIYEGLVSNQMASLPVLSLQYSDYAVWQRNYLEGDVLSDQLSYWASKLSNVSSLVLPLDYTRPSVQSNEGATVFYELDKELSNSLSVICKEEGVTLFMLMLAGFKVLLSRYNGQNDICVGTSIANRTQAELEHMVGFFVNTLALRSDLSGDLSFKDVLQRVKETTLDGYDHQLTPFEKIVDKVITTRDMSMSPLFQVMFDLQNTPNHGDIVIDGLNVSTYDLKGSTAQFDLTMIATEHDSGISLSIEYCTALFKEETVQRMLFHYEKLLKSIVKDRNDKINLLSILTIEEEDLLLGRTVTSEGICFNPDAIDLDNTSPINVQFESIAASNEDAVAVIHNDVSWTYTALNSYANQIAHVLLDTGIEEEAGVGVYLDRSAEFIGCMLGIIKSGGSYTPLDTQNPPSRIDKMLSGGTFSVLITTSSLLEGLEVVEGTDVIVIDLASTKLLDRYAALGLSIYDQDTISSKAVVNPPNRNRMDSWAYVLYTSGSTGTPKGAITRHDGAMNHLLAEYKLLDLPDGFRFLQSAGIGSDISVWQILGPLLKGGVCVIVDKFELLEYDTLLATIARTKVSIVEFVPTYMWGLLSYIKESETPISLDTLQWIMLVGEAIPVALVNDLKRLYPALRLLNAYGPCEASDDVIQYEITDFLAEDQSRVPIGRVIPNMNVAILDVSGNLCPIGVAGELCVSGVGVGAGYIGLPERTAESFVANPFSDDLLGDVLYKTGDLGRWLSDGTIEFLGREDHQVKIRGHRVELEGIASVLRKDDHVEDCHVLVHKDSNGQDMVLCFLILSNDDLPEGVSITELLHTRCKEELPAYMHPSQYCVLEEFPVNLSDKVDGKALIAIYESDFLDGLGSGAMNYVAPRNDIEEQLVVIWQDLLHVDQVGVYDNFFELGGHSLLATRLVSTIRRELSLEIAIKDIFINPTISDLGIHLSSQSVASNTLPVIIAQEKSDRIPLSFSQERLWFIDQLQGSEAYHIFGKLLLKGAVNISILETALKTIIDRHEVLRTVIYSEEGVGYQNVITSDNWKLETNVLKSDQNIDEELSSYAQIPFDLANDYMVRARIYDFGADEYILAIVFHHISSDGWSESVFVREFVELYSAIQEDRGANLPELSLQYTDYALWQRAYLEGEILESQLAYWKDNLTGVTPLALPTDFTRPSIQNTEGYSVDFNLDKRLSDSIAKRCQEEGVTLFMFLLSAFKVLLSKYSGQDDICVGTPIANRTQSEVEGMIGFFVNTLALRTDVSNDLSFKEILNNVKQTTLSGYDNQLVPFEKVVDSVVGTRDMSISPLFQVLFVLQNIPENSEIELDGLTVSDYKHKEVTAQFDLTLTVDEKDSGIALNMGYRTTLFSETTIERMLGHYQELLQNIVENTNQEIGTISMLTQQEEGELFEVFNNTDIGYPKDQSIVDLIVAQSKKTPKAVALVYEGEKLTYKELNDQSNQLARYIQKKGVQTEDLVGICIDRSLEMVIGIVAILKAGGAYVPVDPTYPKERIQYILEDSKVSLVLSNSNSISALEIVEGLSIVQLDKDWESIGKESTRKLKQGPLPEHLAYVIYTSGSTGKPKGVLLTHLNVVRLFFNDGNLFDFNKKDVWTMFHSFCFDFSVWELYGALFYGGRLVIVPDVVTKDSNAYKNLLIEEGVTILNQTPGSFYSLQEEFLSNETDTQIRYVVFGGEALNPSYLERWKHRYPSCKLINMYGITETTVHVTYKEITEKEVLDTKSTIGAAIPTLNIYIVDDSLQLLPIGVIGELCVSGAGLARGYLNREELTQERFISNPFDNDPESRLYKTGDLGRWLPNGDIEFVGRKDSQVKIRGYRIELGEIESVLSLHPEVQHCCVLAKEDSTESNRLIGYVVFDGDFDKEAVQTHLRSKLPDYMVPQLWVSLDAMPLTSNGKIDKKKLPDPDMSLLSTQEYVAPRNEVEEKLATIWKELLEVDQVGVYDNFFELGGHSLLATRLVSLIRRDLKIEMPIKDIFVHPTISDLEFYLSTESQNVVLPAIVSSDHQGRIPLSFSQERLWFLDQLQGSVEYHMSGGLRLKGSLDVSILERALKLLVDRHEILRTVLCSEEGIGYQEVISSDAWELSTVSVLSDQKVEDLIPSFSEAPFDLSGDYMFRSCLYNLGSDDHLLVIVFHHIASDGWSIPIFIKEFIAIYEGLVSNQMASLPVLSLQYSDYAVWQRNYLEGDVLSDQLSYWASKLSNVSSLVLPLDYTRPSVQSNEGATVFYELDKELSNSLSVICKEEGVTLFMLMLAGFKVLLSRYSGQNDICVGTSIANRTQAELEHMVGFFVNTLALRSDLSGDLSFKDVLQRVKETTLDGYDHQLTPFEKIVDKVITTRDMSMSPLFQVMFDLQNTPNHGDIVIDGLNVSTYDLKGSTAQFDLTMIATEHDSGISLNIEYCTALFKEETVQRMLFHYEKLLKSIVKDRNDKINLLSILTTEEEDLLLGRTVTSEGICFNPDAIDLDNTSPINVQFESIAASNEDAVAVIHNDVSWTYTALNSYANQIAHVLLDTGIEEEAGVGVYLDRSAEFIGCMLGIIKSGGSYTPLDTQNPPSRIDKMLSGGTFSVLITTSSLLEGLEVVEGTDVIVIDLASTKLLDRYATLGLSIYDQDTISSKAVVNPPNRNRMDSWAYVLYTSGSTGTPKGAITRHDGAMNHLLAEYKLLDLPDGFRFLQSAGIGSDISVWQILGPLLKGGVCVIVDKFELLEYDTLLATIARTKVSIVEFVPTYMWGLLSYIKESETPISLDTLQWIMLVGEAIPVALVNDLKRLYPALRLLNAYGPCEASDDVIQYEITDFLAEDQSRVPIGRVIPNMNVAILDVSGNLCPIGVAGELCVSGVGVGAGYIGLPERTAESFVANPFSDDLLGDVLYKTGDLGRWLSDGTIEFLGREDHQVKIRGHRVELEGIASVLRKDDHVEDCHVLVHKDSNGQDMVLCFLILSSDDLPEGVSITELLHTRCKEELPAYMHPSQYCVLEEFPVNLSDKVDGKALIAIYESDFSDGLGSGAMNYVAPRNDIEEQLVAIWQDLLGINQIGIHDNFFELGGDSIITIQVVSRMKRFGHHLKPRDLFEYQTISEIADLASKAIEVSLGEQETLSGESTLLPIQQFYFEKEYKEDVANNQSVLVAIDKTLEESFLERAVAMLVHHHDALRFQYEKTENAWIQTYSNKTGVLERVDLSETSLEDLSDEITKTCQVFQDSLSISSGDVFKAILIKTPESESKDRLFLVAHHLVVDGVSWRILFLDLTRIVDGLNEGNVIDLGVKSNSYREWGVALQEYAAKKSIESQVSYWSELGSQYQTLPVDKTPETKKTYADIKHFEISLDEANTSQLLKEVHQAYSTDINDVLLGCLGLTINKWSGNKDVIVGLEGHGREDISQTIDVSTTVGWFTNLYPVCMSIDGNGSYADVLTSAKENLRRIPNKGIGYGVLRYMHPSQEIREQLSSVTWDVVFNYLGQLDNAIDSDSWLTRTEESYGNEIGGQTPFNHKLEVNCSIDKGKLNLIWSYSAVEYDIATITQLAEAYVSNLKALILHCIEQDDRVFTPSDYGLEKEIKHEELDQFLNNTTPDLEELFKI